MQTIILRNSLLGDIFRNANTLVNAVEVEAEFGKVELFVNLQLNNLLDYGTAVFCVQDTKSHREVSEHRRKGQTSIDAGPVSRA